MEISPAPRVPVLDFTGFLGAGKTTLLNQLIVKVFPQRVLVIENEVGKVNVDAGLISERAREVIGLTAGCLCCSLHDEFLSLLEDVCLQREDFDLLVIETTGVADPGSIVSTFLTNPAVERVFELLRVVCVVDAGLIEDWLTDTDEARRQLVAADLVLINKLDTVPSAYWPALEILLAGITPATEIARYERGVFAISDLLKATGVALPRPAPSPSPSHLPPKTSELRHGSISTFTLYFDEAFHLELLYREMLRFVQLHHHQVYRIKGVAASGEHEAQIIAQSVRMSLKFVQGENWPSESVRRGFLVFNGREVRCDVIEKIFGRCVVRGLSPGDYSLSANPV